MCCQLLIRVNNPSTQTHSSRMVNILQNTRKTAKHAAAASGCGGRRRRRRHAPRSINSIRIWIWFGCAPRPRKDSTFKLTHRERAGSMSMSTRIIWWWKNKLGQSVLPGCLAADVWWYMIHQASDIAVQFRNRIQLFYTFRLHNSVGFDIQFYLRCRFSLLQMKNENLFKLSSITSVFINFV